ncbi:hypothetical protein AWC38_SpisGene10544 [Stylophora pistillata]|uniref:Fibrinogen C-terminal domain-containing protein n=1 Tax=Stylophora pistillata TaxID=50429 RepID=A0A2B4S2D7_STYPI|nr:hypothetical protein AWC38_SpisGene10544 [Stylophora pistillata]
MNNQLTDFEVYCDMYNNGGWTLISRFSNNDGKNWVKYSGDWWYDRTSSYGSVTSTSSNYDMISPAFWLVKGDYVKITRSDDSSNTALLATRSCIGGRTFRSFLASYGNFRNGAVWNNNACRKSCYIYNYGGSYSSTTGFSQMHCSSNLKSSRYLSFWCDWDTGDGAVMMIGGGGDGCKRADHGIAITEENAARFSSNPSGCERDFGDDCSYDNHYSLNLWIK